MQENKSGCFFLNTVYNYCIRNLYAKLCFGPVLKCSASAHLMQEKLLLVTFYLNGGLHAITIGKPSERMSHFWTVRFFKNRMRTNIRTKFRFSALP